MNEKLIVDTIVNFWKSSGFTVATEIANFYRSADIAAIDNNGNIYIVECKVSSVGRAIDQIKTHKLSADKAYIGMPYRSTKQSTIDRIINAGVGLIYVMPDGTINEFIDGSNPNVWDIAKIRLRSRILEAIE